MKATRSILVVDDDRAMREMLVDHLRDEGYEAVAAAGVTEACVLLRSRAFACVLSDVQMGRESGFALVEEVKRSTAPVPVVLMSSFGSPDTAERARAAGAVAFLGKPFENGDLLQAIEACLVAPELD
ncbi:MAG: response regulator [Myxococcota bacterium]